MSRYNLDFNPLTLTEKKLVKEWAESVAPTYMIAGLVERLMLENEWHEKRFFSYSIIPDEALEVMAEAALQEGGFIWT